MKKYSVHRQVLQPQLVEHIKFSLLMQKDSLYYNSNTDKSDRSKFADKTPVNSNCCGFGVSFTTDSLLRVLTPFVCEQLGELVLPTFSFARIYWPGAELVPHVDRPSCEISATVAITVDPKPWPIFMDGESIELEPGDIAIYEGMTVKHWREPYEGNEQIQVFCHWVRAQGPHKDLVLDGRPFLGYNPETLRSNNSSMPRRTDSRSPWIQN